MPFQNVCETGTPYGLISFDDDGRERTDDPAGGIFSKVLLEKARKEQPSHIFLFSHGWKGDMPTAIEHYHSWIGAMAKLTADWNAMGNNFRPLFVGLHWPSLPWGDEAQPRPNGIGFGTAESPELQSLIDAAVRHFGGGEAVRQPLEVIFHEFQRDPAARVLSDEALAAYRQLADAIGFSAGGGPQAAPDEEGAPLDPQAAVRAERFALAGQSFGIFGAIKNGVLAGLQQMSFWKIKHRARAVGEGGMHAFVGALQRACDARIHLMGHSFGSIIISSILGGPGGNSPLPKPVNSAVLVQGALSLWSFADQIPDSDQPGYFRTAVAGGAVAGPIVATQSQGDTAVGRLYPAAVGLVDEIDFGADVKLPRFGGVGTWGIQGTRIVDPGSTKVLVQSGHYNLQPGHIYNLDGSEFIKDHSDIGGPEVAHLLWQTARVSGKGAKA
jgi:hypothetical protein